MRIAPPVLPYSTIAYIQNIGHVGIVCVGMDMGIINTKWDCTPYYTISDMVLEMSALVQDNGLIALDFPTYGMDSVMLLSRMHVDMTSIASDGSSTRCAKSMVHTRDGIVDVFIPVQQWALVVAMVNSTHVQKYLPGVFAPSTNASMIQPLCVFVEQCH
jgi:hypothetical protein